MSVAIPKKTKIFIEQTVREKENASAIHNIFQSELWRMRMEAAKVTVDILRTGDSTFSGDFQTPLKLLAQVDGLGPDFLLTVTLENISATKIVRNLSILLHANPEHYKIGRMYAELTPLVPGNETSSIQLVTIWLSLTTSRDPIDDGFSSQGLRNVGEFAAKRHDLRKFHHSSSDY